MHVTVPLTAHARTQRLLAPCKHTRLLLERQDVVQPHDVPVVSGSTRAADTSDDDPLSASMLSGLPPNDTMSKAGVRFNVCNDDFVVVVHTSKASLPTMSATSPRMNKTCSTLVLQLIFHSVPHAGTFGTRLKRGRYPQMYAFRIYADRRQR